MQNQRQKLGQFLSTAICGNDILSSVLYVSAISIGFSGLLAPVILLGIVLVLFIYRGIYREVVESLPINGGTYNALLNGTSKRLAATAAVLTILSYVATSVISGKSAIEYLNTLLRLPDLTILNTTFSTTLLLTAVILTFFAGMVVAGVKDSAKLAAGIFIIHIFTLTAFVVLGLAYKFTHSTQLSLNFILTQNMISTQGFWQTIFVGFAASLLGVSGFESSADFVQEQKKGVFKKTLRNMLIGVAVFNPLIAFLALNINSLPEINANRDFLLAEIAGLIGGDWFKVLMVIDAFLVLCGAVLTSFIGVSGLMKRLALDEIIPEFFGFTNASGAHPRIVFLFLTLSLSILYLTKGDILNLGGVYAISFLAVMSLFAIANLILKYSRKELKRLYKFPSLLVFLGGLATFTGVIGNILIDPANLFYFIAYFVPGLGVVLLYMHRDILAAFVDNLIEQDNQVKRVVRNILKHVTRSRYVLFIKHPQNLYAGLRYINENEAGRHVVIVHCKDKKDGYDYKTWLSLKKLISELPKAGVFPHLEIELCDIHKPFGPEAVSQIVEQYKVPFNRVFVGSVRDFHDFNYDDLGGVRIIL